jgi:tektin-4
MATSTAFLPRERHAGPPMPAIKSTNVFGGDAGSSAPNEAYFPGYYPGYSTYQSINNDKTQFDPMVSVNVGPDQGMSTVGFRVNKYNPNEWHHSNYAKYYQAFSDRNVSEQNRWESNRVSKETEATTNKSQALSTKRLAERLHDVNFWKNELNREIEDVIAETDVLVTEKRRCQRALDATTAPLHIATESLNNRELHRYGIDRVVDDVEIQLRKEIDLINNVQHLLRRTIDEAERQIKANRNAKHQLEHDWSNKFEADRADNKAWSRKNTDVDIMFYPGAARYQETQSTPESWAQNSHDNIVAAENERMASIQMRELIKNILQDTAKDMREQADRVENAFARRIEEMAGAKAKMENQLENTLDEIARQENNIIELKKAIKDKENPMKVAQTRLHDRSYRPGIELCRDPAHTQLVGEVLEISQSVDALIRQLNQAEENLNKLNDDRLILEKEIAMKTKSLYTDRDKCLPVRNSYPSVNRLLGYNG